MLGKKGNSKRKNNVLKGDIKINPADIFTDFGSLPNKAKKNVSRAVTKINGVFLKSAAKNMSPVSFNIDQADTPFCVACSNARVILYTIVKYYESELSQDDVEMLYKFYIYCQTNKIDGIEQDAISHSWLELFINQLNQNSIFLIRDVISLGYHVTSYNSSVFKQGQTPDPNQSYTQTELSENGININRLFEILNTCAGNIANKNVRLKLISINGGPKIIRYFTEHPNIQHAVLSFFVGNLQILANPPRDGDITNAFSVSNQGHAMYLYKIDKNELIIKNSHYLDSNGPPMITNSGKKANALKIDLNKIDPNSIRHLIFVQEEEKTNAKGFTRKHRTRLRKTRKTRKTK